MRSGLTGLAALAVAIVLAGSAYHYGMFFDPIFYRWESILIVVCLFIVGADLAAHSRKADTRLRKSAPAAFYGLLAIALLYAVALIHRPASMLGSFDEALRWTAYTAFAITLYSWFSSSSDTAVRQHRLMWLSAAIQGSGAFVILGAIAGWMGWIAFPEIIMTTGDARLSAVGARLSGFMQYPNFLGAVAGAYLLFYLLLLIRGKAAVSSFIGAAAGVVPAVLVLLLTESRGAWLVTALAWVGGLLLLRGKERITWLIYSGWALISGGAAYRAVVHAGLRSGDAGVGSSKFVQEGATSQETLLLILIGVAAPAGFIVLRWMQARGREQLLSRIAWGCWLAGLFGMVMLLPSVIQGRLSGGFQTAGARGLFYKDAWLLMKEAPFFGRGGDTWRMLFTQVQTAPYVGNEVHSGYIEFALDLGLIGLLIAAAVLFVLLRGVWRSNPIGLLPISVLLLHAAVDFDMSFGYYWLLLLSWVVYYSGEPMGEVKRKRAIRVAPPLRQLRTALLVAAAASLTAAAVFSVRFDRAAQYREAAVSAARSAAAQTAALRAALGLNPYWTRIRLELAALASPPERAVLLAAGLRYEPQSVPLLWALGEAAAEQSDVHGAAAYWRLALHYDRYDRDKQTDAVVTMAQLADGMRAASRLADARLAAQTAIAFFEAYEAQKNNPGVNGRKFAVTAESQAAADQSRLLLKQLEPTSS
ncbi:O-antigen ligase family protein [Paenibacillus lignilyticus]|uniref:O-antigen ligase family protein n=1 Tax=Paenibacillus lignilyticus TaxID=1172615 RepID=A0ABS5C8M9_9BACL|nr:O-antigen ligase family protein [Paenibacillus lignilyticus]MBP3962356.1 O-antigen ligase family protein [Paenibacillus lignilyticus]